MGVSQEFLFPDKFDKDYLPKLKDLDVEIVYKDNFAKYAPNHQSDIFRWWFLKENGGFYLDADQIILKSFKTLPLKEHDFIYSSYKVKSPYAPEGMFCPVGVLGADMKSNALKEVAVRLLSYYSPDNYNCIGPLMFMDMLKKIDKKRSFNAPPEYFYPAPICDRLKAVYSGDMKLSPESYSLHWFGGFDGSQVFNRAYTEEFAKTSNDTISRFIRERKLI